MVLLNQVTRIRGCRVALTALLLALLLTVSAWGASPEYQIKAAFLLNFTRYIEWPRKSGDLQVCVIGPDVFGNALNDVVAGKVVNGRKLVVRTNVPPADAVGCDMVYVAPAETQQIREALKALESSAVVTVGENAEFLRLGGMIAFAPLDGRVRFYINGTAAQHAGINISSRLMVLGRNPRDEGERLR